MVATRSTARASEGGITILNYEVTAQVGGKLAQMGSRLIDSTSKKLASQFFANLNEAITGEKGEQMLAAVHRLNELFDSGVTVTDIERHYVFLSEFMWEVIDKRADGKLITIYDLEGTKFADLSGVVMKVFRTVSALYQE